MEDICRPQPTSKKNRRSVLALPNSSSFSHWPLDLEAFAFIFSSISQFIRIVECYHLAILFNNSIAYSVKVTFRQDKYFFNYLCFYTFMSFSVQTKLNL